MHTHTIQRVQEFDRLRGEWEAVMERDPHANVFSSWGWLRGWIDAAPDPWIVLAAVPPQGEVPVAFLALGVRSRNGALLRGGPELYLAGSPMSDQASLVCAPEFADRALPALAGAVQRLMKRLGAIRLEMREVADPRWDGFLRHFGEERFTVIRSDPTPCPRIPLPDAWTAYIEGSRKRKSLLRRAEREGFVVTHVGDETLEAYTAMFLELHQRRLGEKPPAYLDMMRSLLRWTHRAGILYLVVLWNRDEPMAVNVAFLDRGRGVFHAYNGGWDEWYRKYAPRRVLELYSIRFAIESGFRTYDLGRGAEGYKFGFGAVEHFNRNPVLVRRTAYSTARELVRRLPELLPFQEGSRGEPAPARRPSPARSDGPPVEARDGAD
jgi:CelD/BcsL family acetyltransferase involved in cellulose biosynthesis